MPDSTDDILDVQLRWPGAEPAPVDDEVGQPVPAGEPNVEEVDPGTGVGADTEVEQLDIMPEPVPPFTSGDTTPDERPTRPDPAPRLRLRLRSAAVERTAMTPTAELVALRREVATLRSRLHASERQGQRGLDSTRVRRTQG